MDGPADRPGFLAQVLVRDDHSWLVPRIRAAIAANKPPVSFILTDPSHTEYDAWDIKLASALYIYDDIMRGNIPIYWDESDRVAFDVKTGVSKSRAKIDAREEQDHKAGKKMHGTYYYAVPRAIDGGPLPTMEEWLEEKEAKRGKGDGRRAR